MGKRRDRRHAVLGAGGRRMKLDLTNDDDVAAQEKKTSISTTVEEGGERTGVDSDERLSPHSLPAGLRGWRFADRQHSVRPVQVNPLSLLGQYSDEDEEEENTLANGSSGGLSAVAVAGRLDEQVADFLADLETSGLLKDDDVVNQEDGIEAEGAKLAKSPQDVDTKEKEVICEWEAVLHKDTNEYYYWNKVTGETTWEKPSAYAASEALKSSDPQDRPEDDSKLALEDPHSRSEPAHETLVQEAVSTIDVEAKDDLPSGKPSIVDSVEGDHLKNGRSEGNQDAGRDHEDGMATDICLEAKESLGRIDSPSGIASNSCPGTRGDSDVAATAAFTEHGAGETHHIEESKELNIIENNEDAEDPTVESISSEGVRDNVSADQGDASELENSDLRKSTEEAKRYDHHRLLERGEVLAQKFKILAGEALRCLSSKIRLAVESEVRLSDCKAMAMHDSAEDQFWEHMDSQITRLESLLLVEQAASSLEADQQVLTINVEDANPQSRAEGYVHEAQGIQHEPAAVLERSFKPAVQPRSDDEDMDVDMDVDMETEDQNNVGTSAASRSVDHDVSSALPASLLYGSTVPQPMVYMPPASLPQVVSYGHVESLPLDAYLPPPQSLLPLSETPLFPVAPLFPSVASVFPAMQSSVPLPQADSWVPPPPPEEEWAPPPLPDQEAPPPPPDDDEPPLPSAPDTDTLDPSCPSSSTSVLSSRVYQTSQENTGSEKHDSDSARFDTDSGSIHVNGNGLAPSAVSTGAAETITKKSSSKVRNKKRSHSTAVGSSRMSKKKVSTLVNKWMAAQEELHSSDEEEEDKDLFDFEALEKKRQKEIEEWRHQTLASGGALENANFQPLGTLDWRERVKRAKKEASKLAAKQEKDAKAEESTKDSANALDDSNPDVDKVAASTTPPKKPDLKELSKDLPPGWQAFWDAASRDVYYGNLTTSETSWDRPV
ncbi:hypothetical protein KC19_3G097700 [Ceratodon purpureus]|uniref:WW domain-containing protein n=1 Tax=Ceratodon purpureus TaxID=3225 RepID=A0A8T0IGR1_CERPU|nr:hypothetical protein KC19_3G097700 [Ceratodon purpureus]